MTGDKFEGEILKILTGRNLRSERLKHEGRDLTNCDYLVFDNTQALSFLLEIYGMTEEKNSKFKEEKYGTIAVDLIASMNNLARELRGKNKQLKETKLLEQELNELPTVLAIWLNDMFVENGRFPTYNEKGEHNGFAYPQIENMVYGSLNPTFYPDPENPMYYKRIYEPEACWYNDFSHISAFWFFCNDPYLNRRLYINPYALIHGQNLKELLKLSDEKVILQHSRADEIGKILAQKKKQLEV